MTASPEHPAGLLTEAEQQTLIDPQATATDRTSVYQRVRDRLRATLTDCQILYPTLRDADVTAVFCPDSERDVRRIRASTQDALGLLALGMLANDDLIETRVRDAIRSASLAHGEEVAVECTLRRGPFPTLDEFEARVRTDSVTERMLATYEQLLFDSDADASRVAAIGNAFGLDLTADQIQAASHSSSVVRPPQTAVLQLDVSREEESK